MLALLLYGSGRLADGERISVNSAADETELIRFQINIHRVFVITGFHIDAVKAKRPKFAAGVESSGARVDNSRE